MSKLFFASDNWAPAHPKVMEAVLAANVGFAQSYGGDPWTERAENAIQEAFGFKGRVYFVPSGTGSNVLALKIALKRYESVICSEFAHINTHESAAAESVAGCKLLPVPGKVTPEGVQKKLAMERPFGKHVATPRVVSITQSTEVGTVYSLAELEALVKLCKEEGLLLHMDGSRLYNAAARLDCSLKEMVQGADIVSLGGTKNGLMGAEAVLILNPDLEEGSAVLQKQTLQLLSKNRFLAAQYLPFFEGELWRKLASAANDRAQEIGSAVQTSYPVETNQVFLKVPLDRLKELQEKVHCHIWDHEQGEVRLIASWNTTKEEVNDLIKILK